MATRMLRMAALILGTALLPSYAQQIAVNKDNRTIAVTTSAEANAEADIATVQIGFLVYGPDQDAAYALGSKTSNAIAAALKAAGVPADAIQSESQSISPAQQYGNNEWTAAEKAERKFQVEQSWNVRTAAANGATVLDVAVKAGANQSGQMTWNVTDQDALQAKAAKLALDRAHGIAQQMAAGLNATLGALLYASNDAPARNLPLNSRSMLEMQSADVTAVKKLSVSPQKVRASATVYAVFSIQ